MTNFTAFLTLPYSPNPPATPIYLESNEAVPGYLIQLITLNLASFPIHDVSDNDL